MHEWIAYTYLCNIHTYLCKHTYFCNLEIAYSSGPELQVAYNLCTNEKLIHTYLVYIHTYVNIHIYVI